MAPPRRRAQLPANATELGAASSGSATGHQRIRRGSSSDNEEDALPPFDIVSACMQYSTETERKHKQKGDKFMIEAKKVAAEYEEKVKMLFKAEAGELDAAYQEYAGAFATDEDERNTLLEKMYANFQEIEKLTLQLEQKVKTVEDARYQTSQACLERADIKRQAATQRVASVISSRRKALQARANMKQMSRRADLASLAKI